MLQANPHYRKLAGGYLFATIERKVAEFRAANPDRKIIKLGIGDVTGPLATSVTAAFHQGVDDMARSDGFRGYGPYEGYDFLREAIARTDFPSVPVAADEIFVSDGAKCDSGNFQEIFSTSTVVAVPDPVYPVYVDTNVMAGRTGSFHDGRYEGLVYLDGTADNDFVPGPPTAGPAPDLIYLCFPNNPTGATAGREVLSEWVAYAARHDSLILFDAAYEAYIRDPSIPHSIFEIEGAREVAVEFRSLSKTAGFTGARLAYTVVPRDVQVRDADGGRVSVAELWARRQATKFNGVSYPVQRAASAVYTPEGQQEVRTMTDGYLANAGRIRSYLEHKGYRVWGGLNAPYVWVETRGDAWAFFDRLLLEAAVVVTPGVGFGRNGEGFIRISAFARPDSVEEALQRLDAVL